MTEGIVPRLGAQMEIATRPDLDVVAWVRSASLRNWWRDEEGNLHGEVCGHPEHEDGTDIATAEGSVVSVLSQYRDGDRLMAQLWLTLYELTSPDGGAWFAEAAVAERTLGTPRTEP